MMRFCRSVETLTAEKSRHARQNGNQLESNTLYAGNFGGSPPYLGNFIDSYVKLIYFAV